MSLCSYNNNMPPNATAGGQSITDSLLSAAATAAAESEQNPTKLQQDSTGVLFECDAETIDGGLVKDIVSMKKADRRKLKLVWRNIILFGYLHLAALYGAWLIFTSAKWQTIVLGKFHRRKRRESEIEGDGSHMATSEHARPCCCHLVVACREYQSQGYQRCLLLIWH